MKEFEASKERLALAAENLAIWNEAKEEKKKLGLSILSVYNNFYGNLKNASEYGLPLDYRKQVADMGLLKKPTLSDSSNSEKFRESTFEQFYEDFDHAVEVSGAKKQIDQILTEYQHADKGDKAVLEERLNEAFKPVWIELRLMGYNHQDIIA